MYDVMLLASGIFPSRPRHVFGGGHSDSNFERSKNEIMVAVADRRSQR
ncbi:MAG: hypothetical protein WDN45_10470 [Caulobacteraceae bacterium]